MDTEGKGEAGTNWQSSVETHTGHVQNKQPVGIRCKPQAAHTCALQQDRGVGGLGWEVGGRFKREGPWPTYADTWQKPAQHRKAIIPQLKIKFI